MKKPFIVGVREVHARFYAVTAENEEEAKELVNERAPEVKDLGFSEYSHELNRETWSVERSIEKKTPKS